MARKPLAPVSAEPAARKRAGAAKPPHPADVRRAEVLTNPAGYSASIRALGRNNTIPGGTLPEVAAWAYGLEQAVSHYGATTRATVYALPRDGGGPEVVERGVWLAAVPAATRTTIDRNVARHVAAVAETGAPAPRKGA